MLLFFPAGKAKRPATDMTSAAGMKTGAGNCVVK